MNAVLTVLVDPILPVFAVMFLGFFLGWRERVSLEDARVLNSFAMQFLMPVFLFGLLVGTPVLSFSARPLLVYAGTETLLFLVGFGLARKLFGRPVDEAILLGFAGIFANNAFYVLPISVLLYGPENVLPVTAIVALDAFFAFGCSMIALQIIRLHKITPAAVVSSIVRIPIVQGLVLGVLVSALGIALPAPADTFVSFTGAAAAPVALFALGVTLSQTRFRVEGVVVTFTLMKLLAFPLAIWTGLQIFAGDDPTRDLYVLAAAGPTGAMSFSLALLYGVRIDAIAQIIVWTSLLTLGTLAFLA